LGGGGQLVTAKMDPTRFFLLSAWARNHMETHISSQRRQDSIAQRDAALAPLQRLSARAAKERKKRNNNQKVYFLFLLKRGALLSAKER
jgi:hypothetical protein